MPSLKNLCVGLRMQTVSMQINFLPYFKTNSTHLLNYCVDNSKYTKHSLIKHTSCFKLLNVIKIQLFQICNAMPKVIHDNGLIGLQFFIKCFLEVLHM